MILAYFIYKITFDDRIDYEYCCDNYIYNCRKTRKIPIFDTYNLIAKFGIIYIGIVEYFNL